MARRFEFEEGGSSKFWEVSVDGSDMTVTYGRIGTSGQTKTKSFATNEAAQKEADKLVAEKTKKGYSEVGGDAAASPSPAAKTSASAAKASAPAAKAPAPVASAADAEAVDVTAAPAPTASPSPPSADAGPSMLLDGELVRFAVPAWVAEEAEVPLSRPLAKKRALSFEKVWEDLFKQHAGWSAGSHHSYRWQPDHPQATPFARELAVRAKKRLDDKTMGEGFDVDLEAATFALLGMSYYQNEDRPSRVLWHWTERVGPELAIQAFFRAKQIQPFTGGSEEKWPKSIFFVVVDSLPSTYAFIHHRELSALRELARAFGRAPVEKALRAALGPTPSVLDQASLAWLVDDEAQAKALVAHAMAEANLTQLGLLLPFLDDVDVVEKLLPSLYQDGPDGGSLVRTAMRLGLPFAKLAFARVPAEPHHARRWAPVLACYPSIHAARLLVPMLENKTNRKLVSDALSEMPAHASVALAEALKKKPKYRDAIDSLLATFSASAKAEAAGGEEDVGEEAPSDAIPKVLASPPWRAKKKAVKEAVFEGLVPREIERAVDLSAVEKRTLENYRNRLTYYKNYTAKTIRDALATGARADASYTLGLSLEDLTALHAEGVMAKLSSPWWQADSYTPGLATILDQHGVGAIDPLVAMAPNLKTNLSAELEYAGASSIAPLAVTWLGAKGSRSAAFAWVKRFPRHAAAGLLPIVLDKAGTSRDRATLLLVALVRSGHREIVLEEAAHHGSAVRDAIQVLLDRDPIELVPAKIPKIPEGLENLPRPKLKDGRVLSREATNILLEALAFSPIDPPYVGIEQVKEACDARSLDAFVEALVRAWVAGGMITAHEWCVRAVALIGSDKAARFLFDRGRAWALDNAKQRAILALDVLGAMGTDLALSLVGRVSRSGARQYMKDRAVEILAEIAAARGLSADELEDRTAPDLGLDESGTMVFDFGPRAFRVGFDEHLRPFAQSADGTEKLDSFPRAAKTDDAEKAKAASEAWKHLKSEAEKVSRDQIARLERMMGEERRVDADVFVDAFVKHPLVGHLAKRLVWGAFDASGALLETFRVAEDRTYATVDDDTYTLPEGAEVGVIHPYTLKGTPGLVAKWGQQLSDYALAQPFGQLARPIVELTPAMLTSRYTDKQAPTGLLFGLRSFGWRAIVQEYGDIEGYERSVGGARVVVSMDPWLRQGESKIHKIKVYAYTSSDQPTPSPVQMSELVFQLDGVVT
jgi:predicted DNA-binding WGR domain protein